MEVRSPSGTHGPQLADGFSPPWPMRWRVATRSMDSSACVRQGRWPGLFFSLGSDERLEEAKDNQLSAIILAGGDGSRLSSLTRKIAGKQTPKQFCPVLTDETLLEQTLRRVSLVVPSSRTRWRRALRPAIC